MNLSIVHLLNKLFEMKTPSLLWFILPFLFACGNNPNPAQNQGAQEAAKQESTTPPTYLEGIYATATAPGSTLESLFDGNPATIWRTRPGTGPDEGIMLYFKEPTAISSVEIRTEPGTFSEGKAAVLEIVGNGLLIGSGDPNGKIALDGKPLKSLFIRIQSTGKESQETVNEVKIATYPPTASAGIADVVLRNDKGEALRILLPKVLKGAALASSTLNPEAAYSTSNLFDGRKEFCWVEGNPANSGEGESIQFRFQDPTVVITAIQIWNGYQRSDEHFESNARLRDFEIVGADGVATTYTLRDTKAGQRIELSPWIKNGNFTLKVKSVYPGKKYKDLAISEILFFDRELPFILQTDFAEKLQAGMAAKAAASPLAGLLNRRISNSLNLDGTMPVQQSLILRADGTFVFYSSTSIPKDESMAMVEQKTFADGNWELLRADAKGASVKIFGKWTDASDLTDYYTGARQQEFTQIFSDVLTIESNKLRGTKMLGEFFFK
jgi:hypothetical protein